MQNKITYTPEQISDAEQFLNELAKVPESKRPFVITVVTAYINGIEAGSAYMQSVVKEE